MKIPAGHNFAARWHDIARRAARPSATLGEACSSFARNIDTAVRSLASDHQVSPRTPARPYQSAAAGALHGAALLEAAQLAGRHVVLATDWEPDDLFATFWLLREATRVWHATGDFPIKSIIAGGGYNRLNMRRVAIALEIFRADGVYPQHIDIELVLGTSASRPDATKFAHAGASEVALQRLTQQEITALKRASTPLAEDTCAAAVALLQRSQATAARTGRPPTLLALKPMVELVERPGTEKLDLEAWSVVHYGGFNLREVREYIETTTSPRHAQAKLQTLCHAPKVHAILEQFPLLGGIGSMTPQHTPKTFARLRGDALPLSLQLLNLESIHWNGPIASGIEHDIVAQYPHLRDTFAAMRSLRGTALLDAARPIENAIPAASESHRAFGVYKKVMAWQDCQVAACDPLIALFLTRHPALMQHLQPARVTIVDWAQTRPDQASNIFCTMPEGDAESRRATILEALDELFSAALDPQGWEPGP